MNEAMKLSPMSEERYPELDALRGIAVLMMIFYHLLFDLTYFYGWDIPVYSGLLWIIARTSAITFLLLVGICFTISWGRAVRQLAIGHWQLAIRSCYPKYLRRGLIIFAGGMLISFATWLIVPHVFVKFGILHLIGISALLQPFFTPLKLWNVLPALLLIALPTIRTLPTLPNYYLFPLGLPYPGFLSLDYYPLIPWFGVILIGMALGNLLYVPKRHPVLESFGHITPRLWLLPAPRSALRVVGTCGRYSLWIYFIHQPAILLLLTLMLGSPR